MQDKKGVFSYLHETFISWRRVILMLWHISPAAIVIFLLLTILTGLLPGAQVLVTKNLTESVMEAIQHKGASTFLSQALFWGVLQGGAVLLSSFIGSIQQYIQNIFQKRLSNEISVQIMEKAVTLEMQHFEDSELYDQLQRATRESGYRPYQVFSQITGVGSQLLALGSVITVLFTWNWFIALSVILAPIPSACSQFFFANRNYAIERTRSTDRRKIAYLQYLITTARTVKEVRLFQLGGLFLQRFRQLYDQFYRVDKQIVQKQTIASMALGFIGTTAIVGVQIYAILATIALGQIGWLTGSVQAINSVQSSIQGFLVGLSQLYQNNLFLRNLFEFLDVPATKIKSGTRPFPEMLQKGIEFHHVSFRYPGTSRMVLSDLTCCFPAGKCVALVGHNGAGKTTIVKLLARLYEATEGQILIDGIPIEEYDLNDLRRHIGAVFQDFVQYEMTVQENIGFGCLERIDEEDAVHQAAAAGGISEIVEQFPQQYKTMMGRMFENGQELSIGQWQKIALSRAFMRRAPVLILDEPTASVDATAEADLLERLRAIARDATTLLIAHRFSTVRTADYIIVLDQGRIIEEGTHDHLYRQEGVYARLFRLQAAGYIDTPDLLEKEDRQTVA